MRHVNRFAARCIGSVCNSFCFLLRNCSTFWFKMTCRFGSWCRFHSIIGKALKLWNLTWFPECLGLGRYFIYRCSLRAVPEMPLDRFVCLKFFSGCARVSKFLHIFSCCRPFVQQQPSEGPSFGLLWFVNGLRFPIYCSLHLHISMAPLSQYGDVNRFLFSARLHSSFSKGGHGLGDFWRCSLICGGRGSGCTTLAVWRFIAIAWIAENP
jgi:hypothetical protein